MGIHPEIIYEDNDIIVCYKPAGLATETRRTGQRDMVSILKNYRADRGETPYIGLVHRLDQPVEGLLVFGKTRAASANLSKQVQERGIGKYYRAVAEAGVDAGGQEMLKASATWTDYLLFDKKRNVSSVVSPDTPQAKKAVLDYRIAGREGDRICFDVALHTGRHHQIRLQMAHHGFPLVGDQKYGDGDFASASRADAQLALCACRLSFEHPATKEKLDFSIKPRNPAFDVFAR